MPLLAPDRSEASSSVLRVSGIIDQQSIGNFSLSISQIEPLNIFVNLNDVIEFEGRVIKKQQAPA